MVTNVITKSACFFELLIIVLNTIVTFASLFFINVIICDIILFYIIVYHVDNK